MHTRKIGSLEVSAIGLGCMGLSHAYGTPPQEPQARAVLLHALERGVTLFDTAALYGFGANEELLGRVLAPHRARIVLASKGGLAGVDGKRVIDGRPESLRRDCEDSLRRLRTEVIDLYYLHRWDKRVPIEDSVGALKDLAAAGKVREIGLSEVSAATLRKAHAVHPIAAVQTEYSLWTRNPEIALLAACRELGAALVPFSPLGRGFLAGGVTDAAALGERDLRRQMPRFAPDNLASNLRLLEPLRVLAAVVGCTPGQLALAWVLAQGRDIVPIPGTTDLRHLDQNVDAADLALAPRILAELDRLLGRDAVAGERYAPATQAEIDTETYPT
ncbi:MAG: aldo/keto reductase [Pseudoxanthomonas sp.]